MLRPRYSGLRIASFSEPTVARGFVNLSRFKHGRAIKRNSKRHTGRQIKKKMRDREVKFHDQDRRI